jgi:Na+/glutamate symporter
MDATQISQASGNSGFNTAFFVGLVVGFILGIPATLIGNWLWERHKKKKRGDQPYWAMTVSQNNIQLEGQMPKTASTINTVTQFLKKVAPKD